MFTLNYEANLRKGMSQIFCERASRRYAAPKPLISEQNCAFAWGVTLNSLLSFPFMTFGV